MPGRIFKHDDPVTWPYRSAIGHGYVKDVARDDPDPAKVLYNVTQVDHHPGEPEIVQHTGAALTLSTHEAVEAAREAARQRDEGKSRMTRTKDAPLGRMKAGPEDGLQEGEFLAYPSTFTREPDSYGDVVAKGAFTQSIQAWKDSGDSMPIMYLHDPNQIVGKAVDMGEDDHGWWVKGQFYSDPASQRIYSMLKDRTISALSFAYNTVNEGEVSLSDGSTANELRQVDVHEASLLPKGYAANQDTSVVAVKAERAAGTIAGQIAALDLARKEGRRVAGAPLEKLRAAHSGIGEFIAWAENASPSDDGKAAPGAASGDASHPGPDAEATAKAAADARKSGAATADALLNLTRLLKGN